MLVVTDTLKKLRSPERDHRIKLVTPAALALINTSRVEIGTASATLGSVIAIRAISSGWSNTTERPTVKGISSPAATRGRRLFVAFKPNHDRGTL